jgi:hypothetical protein
MTHEYPRQSREELVYRLGRLMVNYGSMKSKGDGTFRAWSDGELAVGWALQEAVDENARPIEELMLYALTLLIAAGRGPSIANTNLMNAIHKLIKDNGWRELLGELEGEELHEFKADMRALGITVPEQP